MVLIYLEIDTINVMRMHLGYEKSNSNNVGAESNTNGCQSDYYAADNSADHFTDQSGVDLLQFFKITLNKNAKDRYMLLRIEKELAALAQDQRYCAHCSIIASLSLSLSLFLHWNTTKMRNCAQFDTRIFLFCSREL